MSIKLFTKGEYRHIVVKGSINKNTVEDFETAFIPKITRYEISFLNIRSLPKAIVDKLYEILYEKNFKVVIYVTSAKLSNYLKNINIKNMPLRYKDKNLILEPRKIEAVVIGGSADSLENIISIVRAIPLADISLFIVQHIKSDTPLLLDKILKEHTSYKISYPNNDEVVKKGVIYLNPPDYHMKLENEKIVLNKGAKVNYARPSVSVLFESVSEVYKNSAIAFLSCGYGNDGSNVLKSMQKNETMIVLQDQEECEAKEMLKNAKKTKHYDFIWSIDESRSFFSTIFQTTVNKNDAITMFLKQIHTQYGYDFTKYDNGNVKRRIEASMIKENIKSLPLFIKEVLTKRELFEELLLSISINVTEFFRRPQLYIALKNLLKKEFTNSSNIKLWVAGSSTGQEAYSISMLLQDINMNKKSLIYATDFNSVIIDEAHNGLYPSEKLVGCKVNSDLVLESDFYSYFDKNKAYSSINETTRKKVLFFTHNLVSDSSFNHFDIISCKNVLIYFTPVLQEIVLQLFYDSLNDNGYLLLGESEMLHQAFNRKFVAYDSTNKIYKKVA